MAYACASGYAGTYVVTLSVGQVIKLEPRTGDQIRRFANGQERRTIRVELEERYKALHRPEA